MKKFYLKLCALGAIVIPAQLMAATEQATVDESARIAQRFLAMPENGIPPEVLKNAKGVAIASVAKGGLIWSGRIGDGLVVARTKQGWSGPSFIHISGAGFGPQFGAKETDYVFILNTQHAVDTFASGQDIKLGGALSMAVGPAGASTDRGLMLPRTDIYTYSRNRGLFLGIALEGVVIETNRIANERYYHRPITAHAILSARVRPPAGSARLRHLF